MKKDNEQDIVVDEEKKACFRMKFSFHGKVTFTLVEGDDLYRVRDKVCVDVMGPVKLGRKGQALKLYRQGSVRAGSGILLENGEGVLCAAHHGKVTLGNRSEPNIDAKICWSVSTPDYFEHPKDKAFFNEINDLIKDKGCKISLVNNSGVLLNGRIISCRKEGRLDQKCYTIQIPRRVKEKHFENNFKKFCNKVITTLQKKGYDLDDYDGDGVPDCSSGNTP